MDDIFGKQFKDKYSGFIGVAVGRAEYQHSVPQVLLVSRDLQTGRSVQEWFDESRLEPVTETKHYGM